MSKKRKQTKRKHLPTFVARNEPWIRAETFFLLFNRWQNGERIKKYIQNLAPDERRLLFHSAGADFVSTFFPRNRIVSKILKLRWRDFQPGSDLFPS